MKMRNLSDHSRLKLLFDLNKNVKNIISIFSTEFIARFFAFLSVTYLARILGASNFGVINIGLAVLSYAMIVSNGGLTLFGTKKISAELGSTVRLTGDILLTRIFFSVMIFILSAVIVYIFISPKELIDVIIAYLFFLFPAAFLLEWFFQGIQSMEAIAFGRAAGSLVYFIFLLLFVTHSSDKVLAGIGWTISGIVNSLLLLFIFFKKNLSIKIDLKNFQFGRMLKESLPLGLAATVAQFVVMFPVIYLGIVSDISASGIFSAAYKLIVLLLILDRVFNALFFPKIVRYFRINRNPAEINQNLNTILKIISFFGLSVSLMGLISAAFLITSIFGESFSGSIIVFQVLIGNFLLTLLNSVFTYTLIAMNQEKIYTTSLLAGMIVFLASIPVLTGLYGSAGSAAALVLFELTCFLIMYIKLKSRLHIIISRNIVLPAGFVILITTLISMPDFSLSMRLLFGIAGIICLALITGITKDEVKFIKKVLI